MLLCIIMLLLPATNFNNFGFLYFEGNKGTVSQQKASYCSSAVTQRSQVGHGYNPFVPYCPLSSLSDIHLQFHFFSPRLAACAADLSFMFPSFAVSFGVVCHLVTSAIACWPLYNWAPGLFHCLLENVEATNAAVPLGPKDACSLLCLLVSLLLFLGNESTGTALYNCICSCCLSGFVCIWRVIFSQMKAYGCGKWRFLLWLPLDLWVLVRS